MGDSPLFLENRPEIAFATRDLQPPTGLYIGRDDRLRCSHWGNTGGEHIVTLRILRPNGEIIPNVFEIQAGTTVLAVRNINEFDLTEGFLLSATVTTNPALFFIRGQRFVVIELFRGLLTDATTGQTLIRGYLEGHQALSWPDGVMATSSTGRGMIRSITGTDPAAGAEISESVPFGVVWRPMGITFFLQADGTVITRTPTLVIDDGANTLHQSGASAGSAAGSLLRYTWSCNQQPITVSALVACLLPTDLLLFPGWRIRTITLNLQVGDNYAAPQLHVEEWMRGD